jgi:hypothetical protein
MGPKSFDEIAGYQTAIVSAMIKLDAFAYDYLRPGEASHEGQLFDGAPIISIIGLCRLLVVNK